MSGPGTSGAPATRPVPPGFELLGPLGTGATTEVWAARSIATGATVALKWVPADARGAPADRLRHEAEILASLQHPNVVRLVDLIEAPGGGLVLVTEHAAGGSLAQLLARRGKLTAPEVADLGAALASALAAGHRHRVLHRDVKPGNVLFAADGTPLLADFGVASSTGRAPAATVVGTAEYLDPAVAAGAPPDERSDLYALGVTLYEALAGHAPHTGPDCEAVLQAAAEGRHITLDLAAPDAPGHLVAAVERAMATEPRARQPDVASFALDLLGGRPSTTEPALPWDRAPAPPVPVTAAQGGPGALSAPGGGQDLVRRGSVPAPHRPTRTFGPRPPRPTSPAQVLRRAAVLAPLGALVITAAVLVSPLSPLAEEDEDRERVPPSQTVPCPAIDERPGIVAADLDGDGCPTALRWDGAVLEVPEGAGVPAARYAIGRPGDDLLFGDWDCDGIVTPAVHRAAAGEVIVYDRWARAGAPLEGTTTRGQPGGTATVSTGDDGCDVVEVEP